MENGGRKSEIRSRKREENKKPGIINRSFAMDAREMAFHWDRHPAASDSRARGMPASQFPRFLGRRRSPERNHSRQTIHAASPMM